VSVLPILCWPDARLKQVCDPVSGNVSALATDMLDTMYAAKGRGLAAPQVGHMVRLFVMDTGWKEGARRPRVFVNPEVEPLTETLESGEEACLSIPGVAARVMRPPEVLIRWTDLDGVGHEARMTGFDARCVQHEVDHLNGLVIFDRLPPDHRAQMEKDYAR
jgi:peptide deformylase